VTTTVSNNTIQCCDYYEKGAGYEFSMCGDIGVIIRPELIGGAEDIAYASMAPDLVLSPLWTDLGNLINNYCDARSTDGNSSNSANSTLNTTLLS